MEEVIEKKVRTFRLPMDLQRHAEGDPPPADPPADPPKTHTQADIDKAVQDRLPRAEKAAQKALAVSLGFESVEAMQIALKPKDPPKDKDAPVDIDKLVGDKMKEQNDKLFRRSLSVEVKAMANELGFVDWEEAMALADLTEAKEDEKGNVVAKVDDSGKVTSIKEALEELAKKKPHLVKAKPGGTFGANLTDRSSQSSKEAQDALIKQAQSRGVIPVQQTVKDPWG